MAKRFKIEMGLLGAIFSFLLLVCLFLWMFIFGVWFGQKLMGKGPSPVAEKALKMAEEPVAAEEVRPPEVKPPEPKTPKLVERPKEPLPEPKREGSVKRETPREKKKTTTPATSSTYYALQVASFKVKKEAEKYASFFRKKGYFAEVVKADIPKKGTWYRVYVGRFSSLEEARRAYEELKRKKLVKEKAYIKAVSK